MVYVLLKTMNKFKRFCKLVNKLFQVIIHPQFVSTENDIALIELDRPAVFGPYVSPICLPNGEEPSIGTNCFATGYGVTGIGLFILGTILKLIFEQF